MLNRVVLVGRLTRDVELRNTQQGTAVGSFTLAVNRNFTNQQGEREADFINAVIWRQAAENFAKFTGKGALVAIEGRLQTRNYENQQGQRVYVTEVVVDNFSLLESKAEAEARRMQNGSSSASAPMGAPTAGDTNPFATADNQPSPAANNNATPSTDPFAQNTGDIDISEDDLPF